jgi:predicted nucleic acid-binding protein
VTDFIIVDTDILIDAGRGINEAIAGLQKLEKQSPLAVSAVTQMEFFFDCRNKVEQQQLESFLKRFIPIKLNEQVSDTAIDLLKQYRLNHGLLIAASLIAATALAFDVQIITKNQRDYQFIAGLKLLSYP